MTVSLWWPSVRKALAGIAAFVLIFGGWVWMRNRAEAAEVALAAASPLPDGRAPDSYCSLWFVGSSSMRQWKRLSADMLPWDAHNRGIAGASLPEITRRFTNGASNRLPRAIVFYAGENDIAFGVTPENALKELKAFVAEKRKQMGETPVFLISLKPSPLRWDQRQAQLKFNSGMQALAGTGKDLFYIDAAPLFLTNGHPGPYYNPDELHLNDEGYKLLTNSVRKSLDASLPASVIARCSGTISSSER